MHNIRYILFLLSFALLLCACTQPADHGAPESTSETETIAPHTSEPTAESLPDATQEETEPTVPLHSQLYLPDYTPEQIMEYFEEVVLNVEYSDGTGSDELVKKWLSPIYYQIYGTATEADTEVLNALCQQLNAIPGFPGIYAAADPSQENISISFLDPAVFTDSFSDVVHGEDAFGAAQFWYYTATNELHTARIGCRTDLEQPVRNSVLPEEIINILGLSDSTCRPDSITYQYSNENTALSDVDLVILKLLYDPAIQCGFDAARCREIIRELYY